MTGTLTTTSWQHLINDVQSREQHLSDLLRDPARTKQMTLDLSYITLDYSRNCLTNHTLSLFATLANDIHLRDKINALFNGEHINFTENRPALHTLLRDQQSCERSKAIHDCLQQLSHFVNAVHQKTIRGATNKPIDTIVNIGMGGSHLGPKLGVEALTDVAVSDLQFHFISTLDHAKLHDLFLKINPETTLFIVSSKSFTTFETMTNANTIVDWMRNQLDLDPIADHFVAVTANTTKALEFGIKTDRIFPMWEWIGGRYSIWSAIGLPIMLSIGMTHFRDMLAGAHQLDQHFLYAPFEKNLPFILAALSVWYANFFGAKAQAIVPYSYRLTTLIPYLQQLVMESNGKPTALENSLIIFGQEGSDGQHAYHQYLHQTDAIIPADFIVIDEPASYVTKRHHALLIASAISQADALAFGKPEAEAYQELISKGLDAAHATQLATHYALPGNKPSNMITLKRLDPFHLGALIATYEHKTFVEAMLLGINPFDQFGVELGKQLLPVTLEKLKKDAEIAI